MKYDFDAVVNRGGSRSAKYDERTKKFDTGQVIPLWIADMDFRTARPIVDAPTTGTQEGIWSYTSRPDSYFETIRGWQKRHNGWDIDSSLIGFSLDVMQSISTMVKLFTSEEGSVLIQTPVYSEFYGIAKAQDWKVLENPFVEKDGRWEMDWADFGAKLAEANLFLLCSPHNPLGVVWTPEELRRMVEPCIKHQMVLFSDEIHSDLIFHSKRHAPTTSVSDGVARYVVTGISGTKTFSLASLQASTVAFPSTRMKRVFDQFWMNTNIHRNNALSLTAMEAAFNHGEGWLEQLLPYLSANFDFAAGYCREHIPQIKTYASGATYLMWLDYRAPGLDNDALYHFVIEQAGPGLNDGCSFGRSLNGYMRLNATCPRSVLERTMEQLEATIKTL